MYVSIKKENFLLATGTRSQEGKITMLPDKYYYIYDLTRAWRAGMG